MAYEVRMCDWSSDVCSSDLTKEGDGVLVLAGANLYTGGTAVNAGTLRAGSAGAFGSLTAPIAVNTGATLDLGGFDIKVGVLNNGGLGGGNVSLGASRLTTGGVNGTFSGEISGTEIGRAHV